MKRLAVLLVLLMAAALASPVAADGPMVYVVQQGDTLFGIAQRYQTTPDAIARLNNLPDRDALQVGQKLTIAAVGGGEVGAADAPGAPVGPLRHSQPQRIHIVDSGETLSGIASEYSTTTEDLVRINGLSSAELISVGQRIILPEIEPAVTSGPEALISGRKVSYAVQDDDTLLSVAFRYGLDMRSVAVVNGLAGSSWLWPGQKIMLPLDWRVKDAPIPALAKRIEVDIGDQRAYAYEGSHLIYTFVVSTGIQTHPTRRGRFTIQTKMPMAVSTGLNLDMPYWMGIYYAGGTENGFHGLPVNKANGAKMWGGFIGRPISYGCIVLRDSDAATLYNWAEMGTVVDLHD